MGGGSWDTGWEKQLQPICEEAFVLGTTQSTGYCRSTEGALARAGADSGERQLDESITCLSNDLIMRAEPARSCLSLCAPHGLSQGSWMLCAVSDIPRHGWPAPRAHTRPGWDQDTSVLCCLQIISLPNRPNLILQFSAYKEHPELEEGTKGTEDFSKARSLTSRSVWLCWLLFMLPNSVPRSLPVCGNNNEQATRGGSRRLCFLVWESVVGASLQGSWRAQVLPGLRVTVLGTSCSCSDSGTRMLLDRGAVCPPGTGCQH